MSDFSNLFGYGKDSFAVYQNAMWLLAEKDNEKIQIKKPQIIFSFERVFS